MIQDEIIPRFKAGMSFSLGGQQYIMSSPVKNDICVHSAEIECYEVTCLGNNEKRCLRTTVRNLKNKKLEGQFDFIKRESEVLMQIQSEQGGLKYFGKGNVMDVDSCLRSCIIVEMPICTLNTLFQDHLEKLNLSDRISLSIAAIEAYSVFLKNNVTWSEEITFNSIVLLKDNRLGIIQGLNTCDITDKTSGRSSIEMGYTFKKNCAQIKAIALGILSNDKDLASKHATPYNLQQFVGRAIQKNKELTKIAQGYSNFQDIFSDYGLTSFEKFMRFNATTAVADAENQLDLLPKTQNQDLINSDQKDLMQEPSSRIVNVNTSKIKSPEILNQSELINQDKDGNEKEKNNQGYLLRNQDANDNQEVKGSNNKRDNYADSMNEGQFILEDLKQSNKGQQLKENLKDDDDNNNVNTKKISDIHSSDRKKQISQQQQQQQQQFQEYYQSQQLEQQQQINNQQMQIELLQTMILNLKSPNQPKNGKDQYSSNNLHKSSHASTFEQRKEKAKMIMMQQQQQSPGKAQSAELSRRSSLSSQTSNEENSNKSYSSPNRRLLNQKSIYSHEIKRIETLEISDTINQYTSNSSNSNYSSNDSNFLSQYNSKDKDKSDEKETISKRKKQQMQIDLSGDIFAGITPIKEEDEKEHNESSNKTLSNKHKNIKESQIILDVLSKKETLDDNNTKNLLKPQYDSKAPFSLRDKTVILTLVVILLIIIIFAVVFGIAFNFGLSKSTPKTIICEDVNCSQCPEFADTCNVCKDDYYLSTLNPSYKPTCVHSCTVDNCADCISDYQVCEECQDGYTLALSKCVLTALSCIHTNCQTCKDYECVECQFGYKLENSQCIKKCASSICVSCDSSDLSKCYTCQTSYTLDTSTYTCV